MIVAGTRVLGNSKHGYFKRFGRLLRLRLVIPVLRAKHAPDYTARGVAIGMLVAMTPTVGVQMPIVFVIWLLLRWLRPAWDFNVVVAMAWTWVTNVVTVPPIYFTFLVTGNLLLGRGMAGSSYESFSQKLLDLLHQEAGFIESVWIYAVGLFQTWGAPMFVGCVPWAILGAWLSFRWSFNVITRLRARRSRRAQRAASRKRPFGSAV